MGKLSKFITSTILSAALGIGTGACGEQYYPVDIDYDTRYCEFFEDQFDDIPCKPVVEAQVGWKNRPRGIWSVYLSDDFDTDSGTSVWTRYYSNGFDREYAETIFASGLPWQPKGSCNKYMTIDWDKGEEFAQSDFCPTTSLEVNKDYARAWAERMQKEFNNR